LKNASQIRQKNASARVLTAARAIAAREGVSHISFDAIAREAGLSKGGVLYNFPTKRDLMAALLRDMLSEHESLEARLPQDSRQRTLRRHLCSLRTLDAAASDVSMAILAVAAAEPDLLDPLRDALEVDLSCIEAEMKDTSLGRLIFFALQGLRFHSLLALPDGGPSVRNELAQKIEEMIDNAH
jgi:AcrR family transcriptional regulator